MNPYEIPEDRHADFDEAISDLEKFVEGETAQIINNWLSMVIDGTVFRWERYGYSGGYEVFRIWTSERPDKGFWKWDIEIDESDFPAPIGWFLRESYGEWEADA